MKVRHNITITLPSIELPKFVAWNIGKNLMKSSMQETRDYGAQILTTLIEYEEQIGLMTPHDCRRAKAAIELERIHGNPA